MLLYMEIFRRVRNFSPIHCQMQIIEELKKGLKDN